MVGKDYTIIPEYRISEQMEEYNSKGNMTIAATASLSLTGASGDMPRHYKFRFY